MSEFCINTNTLYQLLANLRSFFLILLAPTPIVIFLSSNMCFKLPLNRIYRLYSSCDDYFTSMWEMIKKNSILLTKLQKRKLSVVSYRQYIKRIINCYHKPLKYNLKDGKSSTSFFNPAMLISLPDNVFSSHFFPFKYDKGVLRYDIVWISTSCYLVLLFS